MQIGDVVYLKSGGPAMTITEQTGDGKFGVHWFAGLAMSAATFSETVLTVTDPTPALQAATQQLIDDLVAAKAPQPAAAWAEKVAATMADVKPNA